MVQLSEAAWNLIEGCGDGEEILFGLERGFNAVICPKRGVVALISGQTETEDFIHNGEFSVIYCDSGKVNF